MKFNFNRMLAFRRSIRLDNVEIHYETDAVILIELEDQSVWLSKSEVTIEKKKNATAITVPISLLKKKLPSDKLKYYTNNRIAVS